MFLIFLCYCISGGGENIDITTEEYRVLFNTITDAIQKLSYIQNSLIAAQQQAEELVISKEQ